MLTKWIFLTFFCYLSLLVTPLDGIQYQHRADECFCWSTKTSVSICRSPYLLQMYKNKLFSIKSYLLFLFFIYLFTHSQRELYKDIKNILKSMKMDIEEKSPRESFNQDNPGESRDYNHL